MITPAFRLEQDNDFVTIIIRTPHIRAQEVDMYVQGSEFKLYVKPYFLRLHLPGHVVEDERAHTSYDVAAGEITVKLPKETPGEHFPDLDLLTKLLARKGEYTNEKKEPQIHAANTAAEGSLDTTSSAATTSGAAARPGRTLIEVISDEEDNKREDAPNASNAETEQARMRMFEEAEEFDWELPQELPTQELVLEARYGFNNQYQGFFVHHQETENEVNEILDPEHSTPESRRAERIEKEDLKFDDQYYIADFMLDSDIQQLMRYRTVWWEELRRQQKAARAAEQQSSSASVTEGMRNLQIDTSQEVTRPADQSASPSEEPVLLTFTEEEQKMMRELPNKEYILNNEKSIYLGLVDLMFAYCYDLRVTEGESTVESPWTISKLSPTLSALETFTSLDEVLIACIRRSLTYPLYRHWGLAQKVIRDVYVLFRLGKRALLRALLAMKHMFDHHDVYYIYSKLYIDDYCIWIQKASDKAIRSLAHKLHHIKIPKEKVGWELETLEHLALETSHEHSI